MEGTQEHQSVFQLTGQHFVDYFLRYAGDHCNDWSRLEEEHVNLLTAARYCWNAGNHANLLACRETLQPYLDLQGHWADSLMLNEWAAATAEARGDPISAARFTHDRADIHHQRGEYRQAERLYQLSEQAYAELEEEAMALRSRHMRVLVIRVQGRLAEAARLCRATIADARRLQLHRWLAHPLYVQALLARDRRDFRQARQCIEESLDRLGSSDEPAMIAQCRHFLGELALLQGYLTEARAQLEKSLLLSQKVGILRRVAATQRLLGDVARAEEQNDEADKLYRKAIATATRLGDRPQQARVLLSQAQLAADLGNRQHALDLLHKANVIYQEIGDARGEVGVSLLLARSYLRQSQFGVMVRLGGAALRVGWRAELLRPRVLVGMVVRKGRW